MHMGYSSRRRYWQGAAMMPPHFYERGRSMIETSGLTARPITMFLASFFAMLCIGKRDVL